MTPRRGWATRVVAARIPRALIGVLVAATVLTLATAAGSADASRLLVKFRSGVGSGQIREALAGLGAHRVSAIPAVGVRVISLPAAASGRGLAWLRQRRDVRYAERDATALPQETVPDDPFFPQGSLAMGGGAWGWYQTHTTSAWDITLGEPSVVIAILDTGLKSQGLDFSGQVVPGWNVLDNTSNTTTEASNHGTYVAGVAGLAADSASGNAGYCPGCRLMPVQVGTDAGASYSNLASGIIWAADHGARVENLSWAGTSSSATLTEAVSSARSKGVVVFAAAGNTNCDCATSPAATPGVLGVAGVAGGGEKAGDSNYGSWVALAAPEGNMTAWPSLNGAPGYAQVGGTSVAAPAAAGIAGLIFSANPALGAGQVEQLMEASASPVPFAVAHGEVDAMAALSSIGLSDPQAPGPPLNVLAPQVLVATNGSYNNVPLEGSPQVGQKLIRGQGGWRGSSPLSLSHVEWDRCGAEGACVAIGSSATYTVQSADTGYRLRLVVTFTDPSASTSAASSTTAPVGGTLNTPSPPVNATPPVISGTAQAGQALSSSTGSWSEAPTSYSYQWQRCDGSGANCAPITGAAAASYEASAADVGYTLRAAVTASNTAGSATAVSAATTTVAAPPAPPQKLSFTGWISLKRPWSAFAVNVGAGLAEARLSFSSKCLTLSLALESSAAGTLAGTSGPSVLELNQTLAAGTYVYTVSGAGRCPFTLTVTSPAP